MSEVASKLEQQGKAPRKQPVLDQDWINEAEQHKGEVFLPDGRWVKIDSKRIQPTWKDDVYCDPLEVIIEPVYEQLCARIHNSIVAARHCGISGPARFDFIELNFNDQAKGELFDYKRILIDREKIERRNGVEITFCSYFTKGPRRKMLRLEEKATIVPFHQRQPSNADTMCRYSIAIKVFLARAGYPEFCERSIPKAYQTLKDRQQQQQEG